MEAWIGGYAGISLCVAFEHGTHPGTCPVYSSIFSIALLVGHPVFSRAFLSLVPAKQSVDSSSRGEGHPGKSTAALRFPQDGGKVPSDQSETLFDATRYRQFGSCFRHSIMPGENPKCSRAIIDFKGAPS